MKRSLRVFILFFLFIVIGYQSYGQDKQLMDSLNASLPKAKTDSAKIKIYLELSQECDLKETRKYAEPVIKLADEGLLQVKDSTQRRNFLRWKAEALWFLYVYYRDENGPDHPKSKEYFQKILDIYKEIDDKDEIVNSIIDLAYFYSSQREILKQLNLLQEGLELTKKMNFKRGISRFIVQIGFLYGEQGDTAQALNYLERGLELEKEIGDTTRITRGYHITGLFYFKIKHYDKALEYYFKAVKRYKIPENSRYLINAYLDIGETYKEMGELNQSLEYMLKARELSEVDENEGPKINSTISVGDAYRALGDLEKALEYHQKALSITKYYNNSFGEALAHYSLARDYLALKDYKKAEQNSSTSLEFMKSSATAKQVLDGEQIAYQIDSASHDYQGAFSHYHEYINLRDKQNIEEFQKTAAKEKFQGDYEKQKAADKAEQDKKDLINAEEKKKQKLIIYSVSTGLGLVLLLVIFVYRSYREKQKANIIISEQKHLVEEKQEEILASISYAKRLQEAILPPTEFINKHVPGNFVLYKPKDIVAGDFYWAEGITLRNSPVENFSDEPASAGNDLFFIAAADSTGHGVPGCMVSVVCSNALNRTVKEFKITETGKILDKTRELVLETFEKSVSEVKDGMDISLLCIDRKNKKIFWSGANNPLWYIVSSVSSSGVENELNELKADKQPIGKSDYPKPFTTHEINYAAGTTFYLFTDGFADQFGGPNGKKFKYKPFSDLLLSINSKPLNEQATTIDKVFEEWRGSLEQVDDVCVIGIKL